jgi:hypothetical protein
MMIQLFRLHERNECDKRPRDGVFTVRQAMSCAPVRASRLSRRPLAPDHRRCSSARTPQARHLWLTVFSQPVQTGNPSLPVLSPHPVHFRALRHTFGMKFSFTLTVLPLTL